MPETNYNISGTLRLKGGQEFQRDLKSKLGVVKSEFAAISGILSATGVILFAKNLMTAAATQQKAITSINAGLKSTQYAAGLTNSELRDMASGLQKVGVVGDEVVMAGQGMLLTFTNIGRKVFPEATEVMADMALKMADMNYENVNMKDTAIQLGKALNDPITGLTSLARVGVKFTEEQKEMIKTLVKAGDIEGAQQIIIRELKTEFGGLNRELAKMEPGKVQKLANSVGDLKEKGGDLLYYVLDPTVRILTPIADGFNNAGEKLQGFIRIAATAGVTLEPLAQLMEKIFAKMGGSKEAVKNLAAFTAEVNKMDWTAATNLEKQLTGAGDADKLAIVRTRMDELKRLGEDHANTVVTTTTEMTDEEKALLQNRMDFEYDTNKISRARYLAYLQNRLKDFQAYTDEWIGLQKEIIELQQEADTEAANKAKDMRKMDIKDRSNWHGEVLKIQTELSDATLAEQEEIFANYEIDLKKIEAMRVAFLDKLNFMGQIGSIFGQAFTEGLKGQVDSWKNFLKQILISTLDFLEKKLVLAKIDTALDFILSPAKGIADAAQLIAAFAAFEAAKAGVAAYEFGGIVTQPTLALVGEAGQPEIIAPQRDFMSYSRQLINEALAGAGSRNVRGGDVVINQQFNSPLTDRRQARKLTDNVLVPEMRRENKRSQRFLNKSVA